MKTQYDIKFAARKYKNASGEEKTFWSTHGTLWVDEDGNISMKLDSIPQSTNWDGWMRAFKQKPKEREFGEEVF